MNVPSTYLPTINKSKKAESISSSTVGIAIIKRANFSLQKKGVEQQHLLNLISSVGWLQNDEYLVSAILLVTRGTYW